VLARLRTQAVFKRSVGHGGRVIDAHGGCLSGGKCGAVTVRWMVVVLALVIVAVSVSVTVVG